MGNMVYIDGMDKLTAKIKKCQNLDPIKKVVKQNGAELQSKAQRNAPVDTGNLKRNIALEIKSNGMTAECESQAEYAPYVEWGTRYMEAQPHVKPAFEDQKKQFKHDLERVVK